MQHSVCEAVLPNKYGKASDTHVILCWRKEEILQNIKMGQLRVFEKAESIIDFGST